LSPAGFYKLKAKYEEMDLSDGKRLKRHEGEKRKLNRLLADAMLENVVLKDLLEKPRRHRWRGGRQRCGR
jgi:putative transposase